MTPLYISIKTADGNVLAIDAEWSTDGARRTASTSTNVGDVELLETLIEQVSSGRSGSGHHSRLGGMLGNLLFAGDVGPLIREALSSAAAGTVLLSTGPERAHWPWELSRDDETGLRPAIDAGLVRLAGRSHGARAVPARGLLVVPKAAGSAKRTALQAATRNLSHNQDIDIFPADPATGPGMRRALETGAVLVHLDMHGPTSALLDDGTVPIERLGIDDDVWLTVLGGTQVTQKAGRRLRDAGSALVLSHQVEVSPAQSAALEREFYRSLSHGDSVTDALTRARFSLLQTEGEGSSAWAAPVLWAAPGVTGGGPAMMPFPPQDMAVEASGIEHGETPIRESRPYDDLNEEVGHPLSAAVFIRDTVRNLRHGSASRDQLNLRADALRKLGARPQSGDSQLRARAADDRAKDLTDQLVDAIGRPDGPLEAGPETSSQIHRVSEQLGLSTDSVTQACHALLAGRVVSLQGADTSTALRLARLVAEDIFGFHPRMLNATGQGPYLGGPAIEKNGSLTAGGWIYRTAASNWRRDELDPLQPEQPGPSTRMPLVGRATSQWRIYEGAWLVINNAQDLKAEALQGILHSSTLGVYEGMNQHGQPFRLRLPRDFRIILVSSWTPSGLPAEVPRIQLSGGSGQQSEANRWLAEVSRQVGASRDQAEASARRQMATLLLESVDLARIGTPVPVAVGSAALAYAVATGGRLEEAVCAALRVYVTPMLQDSRPLIQNLIRAGLAGRRSAFFEAAAALSGTGEGECLVQLAEYLDRREGAGTDNLVRVRSLMPQPSQLSEWIRLKDSTSSLQLPSLGAKGQDLVTI